LSKSKIVKSYRITLDDKKYKLSPELFYLDSLKAKEMYGDEEHGEFSDSYEVGLEPEEPTKTEEEILAEMEAMKMDIIEQANMVAQENIISAKEDAEKVISDAYNQAQSILENAKNEGYSIGEKDGFDQGRAIADGLIDEAMDIKEEIQKRKEATFKESEEKIVNMIISISETILNKKIDEDYEIIEGLVVSAIKKCIFTENLILRVSTEDFDYAVSSKKKFLALAESVDDIVIKQDNSLKPGSCVLDSEAGSVDSSIWTQFEHVRDKFLELLESE